MDGRELKQRRERMKLSQAALARRLGVTTRGYFNWESGQRKTLWTMLDLALQRIEQMRVDELKADLARMESERAA